MPAQSMTSRRPEPRDPPRCYPQSIVNILARGALLLFPAVAAFAQSTVLLNTMVDELNRNFNVLKQKADPPPYFMSYEVHEQEYHVVSASLGPVSTSTSGKARNLDVSLRVAMPNLDTYHPLPA